MISAAGFVGHLQSSEPVQQRAVPFDNSLFVDVIPESTPIAGIFGNGFLDRIDFQKEISSMADGWVTWSLREQPQLFLRTNQSHSLASAFTYLRLDLPETRKTLGFSVAVSSNTNQPFIWCVLVKKRDLYFALSGSSC